MLNNEDSSDKEIEDGQYETEKKMQVCPQNNMNQTIKKYDTAQDDSKDSDDRPYEEDNMFSDVTMKVLHLYKM